MVRLSGLGVQNGDRLCAGQGEGEGEERATPGDRGGLSDPLVVARTPVTVEGPARGCDSCAHNFAGTLLPFLLFGAQSTARDLLSERESGALLRVRLSPGAPWQVLGDPGPGGHDLAGPAPGPGPAPRGRAAGLRRGWRGPGDPALPWGPSRVGAPGVGPAGGGS